MYKIDDNVKQIACITNEDDRIALDLILKELNVNKNKYFEMDVIDVLNSIVKKRKNEFSSACFQNDVTMGDSFSRKIFIFIWVIYYTSPVFADRKITAYKVNIKKWCFENNFNTWWNYEHNLNDSIRCTNKKTGSASYQKEMLDSYEHLFIHKEKSMYLKEKTSKLSIDLDNAIKVKIVEKNLPKTLSKSTFNDIVFNMTRNSFNLDEFGGTLLATFIIFNNYDDETLKKFIKNKYFYNDVVFKLSVNYNSETVLNDIVKNLLKMTIGDDGLEKIISSNEVGGYYWGNSISNLLENPKVENVNFVIMDTLIKNKIFKNKLFVKFIGIITCGLEVEDKKEAVFNIFDDKNYEVNVANNPDNFKKFIFNQRLQETYGSISGINPWTLFAIEFFQKCGFDMTNWIKDVKKTIKINFLENRIVEGFDDKIKKQLGDNIVNVDFNRMVKYSKITFLEKTKELYQV
jgi:hypothetical protein